MEAFAGWMECLSSLWKLFSFHAILPVLLSGKKLSSQFAIHPCERCFSANPNSHSAARVCVFRLVPFPVDARRRRERRWGESLPLSKWNAKSLRHHFSICTFCYTEKRFECSLGFYICLFPRCTRRAKRSSLDTSRMAHVFAKGSYTKSALLSGTWQQT